MAFKKKTWEDRLSEFPGRRLLKIISRSSDDGEIVVDVSRNEGVVSRSGDAYSAANMNDLEQRIADGFDSINDKLGSYELLTDTTVTKGSKSTVTVKDISNYGYIFGYFSSATGGHKGADSFTMPVDIFKSLPLIVLNYYASNTIHYECSVQYISNTSFELVNSNGSYENVKITIYGIK